MRLFRHPRWQHLDYRVKVATTQENKPPTQGTRQWTFTTPRWRCGSILLPSLNAGVPEPTGGPSVWSLSWIIKLTDSSHIDGLVQDCSNSSALAMELLQSCTKPSIWTYGHWCGGCTPFIPFTPHLPIYKNKLPPVKPLPTKIKCTSMLVP